MANKSVGLLTIAFGADLRGFDKAMKKAQRSIKKFGTSMQRTGKNLTRNLTLPLAAFAAASVRNFDKQQKAIAQLEAGLKSTGNTVGKTSMELQKMASDLQKKTLFGDEEILKNATAQLLTFTNIAGEQFNKTQEIALDLATRLDGDLKSASIMLGKALNDPVANLSALSRAGIQFSTDQKETIKSLVETNRLADAQTIILAELEKQYGGSAEAAAKAGLGPIQQLGMVLSDMSEDIGKILLPSLTTLADKIKELATRFDNLSESSKKNIVKWTAITAAVGPFLILIGKTITSIAFLIPMIVRLGGAFKKLSILMFNLIKKNPWLLLATGIAAIGVAVADTLGAFDKWLGTESDVQEETIKTTETINELNAALLNVDKTLNNVGGQINLKKPDVSTIPSLGPKKLPVDLGGEGPVQATEEFEDLNNALNQTDTSLDILGQKLGQIFSEGAQSFSEYGEMIKSTIREIISGLIAQGVAAAVTNALSNPALKINPLLIPVIAGLASGLAKTAFNSLIPAFANGGLVTGPTVGLIGEGMGTSASNPEVVAPLDKLKGMINGGGSQQVEVYGRISGNDIFISNQRGSLNRQRSV